MKKQFYLDLASLVFFLPRTKKCFLTLKRKMQSRRTSSPTPTGFITAETFRPKFREIRGKNNFFIFEQIPRLFRFRFRSRSERSIGVREPPENTEIKSGLLDYFFHLGFEGEIICGNLCWIGFRSTLECSQGYFLQVRHFIARRWADSMKPRRTCKGHF